jgi:hypothetical protein
MMSVPMKMIPEFLESPSGHMNKLTNEILCCQADLSRESFVRIVALQTLLYRAYES